MVTGAVKPPNGDLGVDGLVSIFAHELAEATSDPYLDAWADARGEENADLCQYRCVSLSPILPSLHGRTAHAQKCYSTGEVRQAGATSVTFPAGFLRFLKRGGNQQPVPWRLGLCSGGEGGGESVLCQYRCLAARALALRLWVPA